MPALGTPTPRGAVTRGRLAVVLLVAVLGSPLGACGSRAPDVAAPDAGGSPPSAVAAPAGPIITASPAETAAVTELLRRRAAAVVEGDEQEFARTVAGASDAEGRRQLASYRAARDLEVSRLTVGSVSLTREVGRPEGRAEVDVGYRVDDLDRGDRHARLAYDVVLDGGRWAVARERPTGAGATAPWIAMPTLRVRHGDGSVVAGSVPASRLEEHVRVVGRALPVLQSHWASAPRRVLVLAPATSAEADALLGRPSGSPGEVAATTEGPLGPDGRATGDRVVLDPTAYARLTTSGREVVLTHELVHVAVRATVPGRPAGWLSEGYADHVAYARADVPASALLAPLAAQVRSGGGPVELPAASDFQPSHEDLQLPYLAAWQAVDLLAEQHGEAAVRRLVVQGSSTGSDADAEAATDRALETVLGTSRAQLTASWRERLRGLGR